LTVQWIVYYQGTFVEGIQEEVVLSPAHALSLITAGEGYFFHYGLILCLFQYPDYQSISLNKASFVGFPPFEFYGLLVAEP